MKKWSVVFLWGMICSFFITASAQQEQESFKAKDLVGEWTAYGYYCEGPEPAQTLVVEAFGPKIVATKIRGDKCVPSGHRTFEGTVSGNRITGVYYVSEGPYARPITTIPATFTIKSKNEFSSSLGSTMKRGEDAIAEEIPKELGAISVTVTNKRTGEPIKWETVEVIKPENGIDVGSAFLTRKKAGKLTFKAIEEGEYRVQIAGDQWSKASSSTNVTVKAGKTAKAKLELDLDKVKVKGRLVALSKKNFRLPLEGLGVKVFFSDGHEVNAKTNEKGYFEVKYDKAPKSYKIETELKVSSGEFVVASEKGFNGKTVWMKSTDMKLTKPRVYHTFKFREADKTLSKKMSKDQKISLEHAATYYYHTYKAYDFAKEKLGLNLDHALPVDATLWSSKSNGATYFLGDSSIEISAKKKQSLRRDKNSPDNREYHEFGHHVMGDSAIGGENTYTGRIAGESNHAGIDNGRSVDSVLEGFAEFFSLWVKGSSVYNWDATTDLENNLQNITRKKRDAKGKVIKKNGKVVTEQVMDEEFQVAALLWDLQDSNQDSGDYIDLTDRQLWALINRVQIKDVYSIYQEVKRPLKGKKSNPSSQLDDVDTLFVAHRFFSDQNKNGRWDAGEKIGVADFYHKKGSATVREKRPPLEQSDIKLVTPKKMESIEYASLRLVYQDGSMVDLGITSVFENALTVHVPGNAKYLEIQPIISGYMVEPVRVTPEEYFTGRSEVTDNGGNIFLTREVTLRKLEVSAPKAATAERDFDGLWLNWEADGASSFTLVEGIERSPIAPVDGLVLYTGTNPFFLMQGIEDYDVTRYFSVFAIDADGNASSPLKFSYPEAEKEKSDKNYLLLLFFGVGGALIILVIYRRKAKSQ